MNEIKEYTEKVFEDIKYIDEDGNEYWLARELMEVLEYSLWQNFHKTIKTAMKNCNNSNYDVSDHFIDANKMIKLAKNARRKIQDYKLSRYACYLIVLNCDPRKKVIALAKTYFAIQTRKQELSEKEYTNKIFEDIKHIDGNKNEYWLARELMPLLEYAEWRKFKRVINKGIINCKNSNYNALDHFVGADKMVSIGSQTTRNIQDYKLTRYACYLIVLNCDPRKKIISLAKTYFAIQTRKQELSELEYNNLTEDEKRLYRRNQARKGNYNLNKTAVNSGVKDLARFHNAGYKGLYNGETADDIFKRKKLRYREDILDNMGSEELADNIFRIAQTDAKLKRNNVDNEYTANSVHYEVGKEVRNSIKRLGGTMPEDLPTPDKSLKELEKENKYSEKILDNLKYKN